MASAPSLMQTLYVQEQGSTLGVSAGTIEVRRNNEVIRSVPSEWVEQIFIFGRITLTSGAIRHCLEFSKPVVFLSLNGRFYGRLHSSIFPRVSAVRRQWKLYRTPARRCEVAKSIVRAKLDNQRFLLQRRNARHKSVFVKKQIDLLAELEKGLGAATTLDVLRGYEGRGAVAFFDAIYEFIPPQFRYNGRNKRPPKDPINVLLSFGYTILYQFMESLILARGMHPAIGCLHERFTRFSCLASDLTEEFRSSAVDTLVLRLANLGVVTPEDFTDVPDGSMCRMSDTARKKFLQQYSQNLEQKVRRCADDEKTVSLAACMEAQVNQYYRVLFGRETVYEPFIFRKAAQRNFVSR